jgi:hypothetical protein
VSTVDESCDRAPFVESSATEFSFPAPNQRVDVSTPNESLLVLLEARDEFGATARPRAQLIIPIVNIAPTIVMGKASAYSYVENTPVRVFAKVGDADDGAAALSLRWEAFGQSLVDQDPAVVVDQDNPAQLQYGKVFSAGLGSYTVQVTASDPLAATAADPSLHQTTEMIEINIVADRPPCLAQVAPIVPPAGSLLPLSTETLFRAPVVIDDLDSYPLIPGDPIFRATQFTWSLKAPGAAAHVPLTGVTGNSYALDPANYTPGDILEGRLEIYDRKLTPLSCAADQLTCSTISDNACLQRQTWRVEVR